MSDITKEEAIKDLNLALSTGSYIFVKSRETLRMAISSLSEDVKSNVHARWEDGHCSNCHVFIPDDLRTVLRDYCDNDFCPNCGADMRGVKLNE